MRKVYYHFWIYILSIFVCPVHLFAVNDTLALHNLMQKSENFDDSYALKAATAGFMSAQKMNENSFAARFLYNTAKYHEYHENYDSANVYFEKAAPYFEKLNKNSDAAKCYINIGVTHYYYGRFPLALSAYNQAHKQLENSTDTVLLLKLYNNLGLVYKSTGYYRKAIDNFHKILHLNKDNKNQKSVANAHQNLSTLYWEQKNYSSALKCLGLALEIFQKLDLKDDIASVYNNYALIYNSFNEDEKVIENYQKAIDIYSQLNNKNGMAIALSNKAMYLDKKGKKKEAERFFKQSLTLFETTRYDIGIFTTKLNLSKLYSETGRKAQALKLAEEAVKIENTQRPLKYLSNGYLLLAQTYADMHEKEKSVQYFQKYIVVNDSVFNMEINKQIAEIRTKFEIEKAEAQLLLSGQTIQIQQLEILKKRKTITAVAVSLILTFLLSIVLFLLYRQKNKLYLALVEHNVYLAKADIEKEQHHTMNIDTVNKEHSSENKDENLRTELIPAIEKLMLEDKPFTQKQFAINDMAQLLNTNRNYLSQIINDYYHTNFNNYINDLRIKESRKMLINSQFKHYSIEGVGEAVGFHSKATFNTSFKKFTGVTPSFYKENADKFE